MTTSKPLVSIVLTSYNKIDYIKEQIQSIYNQTYENWELIICDDLSTDGSIEYLQQLSINNKKIKCIFHEKNLGLCKNFESGLVECKGKYVAVCDADDYWLSTKIEKQVNYMESNPNIDLVYHDANICNDKLYILKHSFVKNSIMDIGRILSTIKMEQPFKKVLHVNFALAPTILFKAENINIIKPFPIKFLQDHWILLTHLYMGKKIGFLNEPMINYRQSSSSMVGSSNRNVSYHIAQIKNKKYIQEYIAKTENYKIVLNQLLMMETSIQENRTLLIQTIESFEKIINYCKEDISIRIFANMLKIFIFDNNLPAFLYITIIKVTGKKGP